MRDMRRILLALCAVAALVVVGCGGSDNESTSSATTSTSTASSSGGGGGVEIKMQNIQFAPKDATVKVGEKVTWTNDDTVDHNVTSQSGETIKSKDFGKGATFSFSPTKAGTIKYVCTLHSGMDGTLTVQ
jgi:plastocyanin